MGQGRKDVKRKLRKPSSAGEVLLHPMHPPQTREKFQTLWKLFLDSYIE
jgi:hypothetical protein